MKAWDGSVELTKPGETVSVIVPPLVRDSSAVVAPAPAPPLAIDASPAPPSSAPAAPEGPSSSRRTIALVVGGVGVAGVVVGTIFGLAAISKKSESDNGCPGGSSGPCYPAGVDASKTAVSDGNVATIAFGVGGAALAGAAVLWLTAPKSGATGSVRVAPTAGARGAGLSAVGSF
jgi:hypothetical protein